MSDKPAQHQNSIGNINAYKANGGTELPTICVTCGRLTKIYLGTKLHHVGKVNVTDVLGKCQICGAPTPAINGTYEFAEHVALLLGNSSVSKKEARRFIRKVEQANDTSDFVTVASAINPQLGEIASLASAQPDPKTALRTAAKIVYHAIIVGSALVTGVYSGQLWLEHNFPEKGSEIEQIAPKQPQDKSDKKSEEKEEKPKSNWPKPTEI